MDGEDRATTMSRTSKLGAGLAAVAAAAGVVLSAAPAAASTQATWPNDTFNICDYRGGTICDGRTIGGIIWGSRTSTLQGEVRDYTGYGTTVYFDAFAGSTKVDSDHRNSGPYGAVSYNFTIGNPDLVGGFDRLRIQVCRTGTTQCSLQINVHRDGTAENVVA